MGESINRRPAAISNKNRKHPESRLFCYFFSPPKKSKDKILYKFNYKFVNMNGKNTAFLACMQLEVNLRQRSFPT